METKSCSAARLWRGSRRDCCQPPGFAAIIATLIKKTSLETCIRVCVLCVNACVTTAVSHDYDERSRGDFHRQTYVDLSDGTACKKFNRRNASLLRLIEECQPFDTSYRPCVSSSVIYTCPTKDNPLTLQAIIFFISTLRRGESRGSYAHRINICDWNIGPYR